jgi:Mlc titration factor MtfA (ptsG expression regulator)
MFIQFINDNLLSILFFAALIVYSLASIKKALIEEKNQAQIEEIPPEPADNPDQLVFYGNKPGITDEDIESSLSTWQPYFKNLQPFLQQKFIQRVNEFMQQKIFIIHSKDGYKEMPILTSAAAIQLSFGLNDFLFPWFNTIEIFTNEFYDSTSNKIINGEVDGNSIAIAWNPFLKGYANNTDRENVGIHEMAHALYYQKMIVDKNDAVFISGFTEVMKQGEKIYAMRNPRESLFNNYAYKNRQEFWAESVEVFFEDPLNMQINYDELFTAIKTLLNQDPRNSVSPVLS